MIKLNHYFYIKLKESFYFGKINALGNALLFLCIAIGYFVIIEIAFNEQDLIIVYLARLSILLGMFWVTFEFILDNFDSIFTFKTIQGE